MAVNYKIHALADLPLWDVTIYIYWLGGRVISTVDLDT